MGDVRGPVGDGSSELCFDVGVAAAVKRLEHKELESCELRLLRRRDRVFEAASLERGAQGRDRSWIAEEDELERGLAAGGALEPAARRLNRSRITVCAEVLEIGE